MASVLYVSYDGVLEPLGRSQVLRYLLRLAAAGHRVSLLSYEKAADWEDAQRREQTRQEVGRAGIIWRPLAYHKRPTVPATAYDVAAGVLAGAALARRQGATIVHARGYVPALIAVALKRCLGLRFIFDMRGFWPEEKVAAGSWSGGGLLYRSVKRLERRFLREADAVVSLTRAGLRELCRRGDAVPEDGRFSVIPTCVDLELFSAAPLQPGPFTLGYLGSVEARYLFEHVLECLKLARGRDGGARLLVVNRGQHDYILRRVAAAGLPRDCVELCEARPEEVASRLRSVHAGIFFYKPAAFLPATMPTRLAEFLACGIPCLANRGIGDCDEVLEEERVGVLARDLSPAGLEEAMLRLEALASEPGIRARCAEAARRRFSLEDGVRRYDAIYRALA